MSVEPIYRRIGERLRVLREMRGESQESIGRLLGLTRAGVSFLELGRARIHVYHLAALAAHFDVKLQELIAADVRSGR